MGTHLTSKPRSQIILDCSKYYRENECYEKTSNKGPTLKFFQDYGLSRPNFSKEVSFKLRPDKNEAGSW